MSPHYWKRLGRRLLDQRSFFTLVLLVMLYTVLVAWLEQRFFPEKLVLEIESAVFNGLVFGLLLAFRTNTAYDRWWEGRKLWGQLVNDSRNLCLKVATMVRTPPEELAAFGRHIVGFAETLKDQLRGKTPRYKGEEPAPHGPSQCVRLILEDLRRWEARGQLTAMQMLMLDPHVRGFMDICGGCERIRATPLAASYRFFLRQGIFLYLFTLPWFMARQFGYWSVLQVGLVSYFMIGLEMLAEDVEEPFGRDRDDLKLEHICQSISHSTAEILSHPIGDALQPSSPTTLSS